MGDWNAKVGKDHETWGPTIGKFGYGEMNDRGERLLYFCKENSLIVSNTLFKHKPSRKWTWTSPDHKSKNMIDLIQIRDRWRSAVDNTRPFQSVDIGCDHSLVLAKIRVKFKVEKKGLRRKKWNINKLEDPSIAKDFQLELQNRFQLLEDEVDTNDPIADSLLEQTMLWQHNLKNATDRKKIEQSIPSVALTNCVTIVTRSTVAIPFLPVMKAHKAIHFENPPMVSNLTTGNSGQLKMSAKFRLSQKRRFWIWPI